MEQYRMPRQGDIFYQDNDKPCQVVALAFHKKTREGMVVYQELYGEFKTFVIPITEFFHGEFKEAVNKEEESMAAIIETDKAVIPEEAYKDIREDTVKEEEITDQYINTVLIQFLEAKSYSKKLEVLSTNLKHLDDRLINDMAVSLDCTVEEGPTENRIQELIHCLQAMCRFEDRRLR